MKTVDARGRSCPEPVIMTQKACKEEKGQFTVIVDNQVAVDNITRFAKNQGLNVSVSDSGEDFNMIIG